MFLSGCHTGRRPSPGVDLSLAEQLVAHGFRAVLGWAHRVEDLDATEAARHLYEHLAGGESLPLAVVRTHATITLA